jgi:hypothetical protein
MSALISLMWGPIIATQETVNTNNKMSKKTNLKIIFGGKFKVVKITF